VLTDADATRAAILSVLYSHLRDNENIQRGDAILIHYSGHGASYDVNEIFNISGSIEAICPVDRGVEDTGHGTVLDISDREINLFLTELASVKGNNITLVLDCCYAGGAARTEAAFQFRQAEPLDRSLKNMLLAAEDNPHKQWASGSALAENWKPDLSSHVVLAACQDFERAWECGDDKGGDFTVALLKALRSLPLDTTTYHDFIKRIGRLPRQQPYAVGSRVGNVIFTPGPPKQITPEPKEAEKHLEPVSDYTFGLTGLLRGMGSLTGLNWPRSLQILQ